MRYNIINSIDWLSVKLTGAAATPLFINVNPFIKTLSWLAILSTLIYNSIRIYKEVKGK